MPKVVDHENRRRELASAVWRLILRQGIEGVSIRDVAAEADWSSGALRHYFKTRDELLSFALRLVVDRVVERLSAGPRGKSPREAVRHILREILPLDADRRAEAAIWFAFANRSLTDRRLAEEQELIFVGTRDLCRRIAHDLDRYGNLAPGRDPEQEAARLHALIDGLAVQGLLGQLDTDAIESILDTHLAELIPQT
jgi:AcrR family transcriptional regulator